MRLALQYFKAVSGTDTELRRRCDSGTDSERGGAAFLIRDYHQDPGCLA